MEHSVISWGSIHKFGELWWEHLRMRKKLFVDEMQWDIPHTDEVESDQYDTPSTIYVISHIDGAPLAASRLNPCDGYYGGWTYMIRDACAGKLNGIPTDLMPTPPTDSSIWEASRFTVDPALSSEERSAVLVENAKALSEAARTMGARKLIALMPPGYIRWLSSNGLPTRKSGPIRSDGQNNRICTMEMPL